ncbi:MAG: hypothetical protein ACHQ50_06990 [Fimbriimonadales bacterium]
MGDILFEKGLITEEQLERALELRSRSNLRLGEILVLLKITEEVVITECLSEQYDLPIADLTKVAPSARALGIVPCAFALSRLFLPVDLVDDTLVAIIADPTDIEIPDDVVSKTGHRLSLSLAPPSLLSEAIARSYLAPCEDWETPCGDEPESDLPESPMKLAS